MITAPKGTHDILPGDAERWQRLEEAARAVLGRYGYGEIRTPMFESTELFAKGVGQATDIVGKEMYTFADKKDRSLSLRPEGTAAVVRAVLEGRLYDGQGTLRLYYLGPMFRYERMQKGRQRQFHQLGVEVFGPASPELDAEVIDALMAFLGALGIEGSQLLVNSIGDGACRPVYRERLTAFIDSIADRLCEECLRRKETNPLRVLDCKNPACIAATAAAPSILDALCEPCARHFAAVCRALEVYGLAYRVEPRLVRGLDYYMRTTFEVVHGNLGAQNALGGGGRYDGLSELLGGPHLPGVGWAAGIERLLLTVPPPAAAAGVDTAVVAVGEAPMLKALALAQKLRQRGESVVMDFKGTSFKAQMKAANKCRARRALILGEDELQGGVVTVKDLASGEQRTIKEDEL